MAQGRLKGVLLGFAGEVIAARAEVSHAEDHALCEFAFHIEVVLKRVWELRVVSRREGVDRQRHKSILWVQKLREKEFLRTEKRRECPVDTKQECGELVAINAKSAPHHSFAVAGDIPC